MFKITKNIDHIIKYISESNEINSDIQEDKLIRKFLCAYGYNNRSKFWKSIVDENKAMSFAEFLERLAGL